ncbi:MAG: DEAD/DEAH box helicase, partial [Desulfatiglandales bacterium]
EEEIERRRLRASQEPFLIKQVEPGNPFYGRFACHSKSSGRTYLVEIRSLTQPENACQCPDFISNGLGTCKHIEAVLFHAARGQKRRFDLAAQEGSPRVEVYLSRCETPEIKVAWPAKVSTRARTLLSPFFSNTGSLLAEPVEAFPSIKRALHRASKAVQNEIRIGLEVEGWVDDLSRRQERAKAKDAFLKDVGEGKQTLDFLKLPLYPYQKEGLLHLCFGERAMLADEMGLGKTAQAIGACELLRQRRRIERVLVVSPASLKAEWEEQISKFTGLPVKTIWGTRGARLKMYREPSFFYLTNYEQVRSDYEALMQILAPDVVILDEAQRIKNWSTKTAKTVKRLSSPYAFVLTGTPLENRIDEIYSLIEFLDPQVFGSLFRFNREFYELDEKGRPVDYKNLEELHRRIRPHMLRRRKEEIEDQLPARTINNYFVAMEPEQDKRYGEYQERVARLVAIAKRRPLSKEEFEKLQKWLACMRMICDTPYILDQECRICPKLHELASVLEDLIGENGNKVLIFTEWERMLFLVRELAQEMEIPFAWHTGSVPQQKRRQEIRRFKKDPECRLFLSTDSGSLGLNLQDASAVVNLDLPWNPAKLEQRIGRAWRKHQTRSVKVINLVSENTIEHRMLGLLSQKQKLADTVLDGKGDFRAVKMPSGRAALMERLEALMGADGGTLQAKAKISLAPKEVAPKDPYQAFYEDMAGRLSDRLLLLESCRGATGRPTILLVIQGDTEAFRPVAERLVHDNFTLSGEVPFLELMERTTYETIKRLVDSGVLKSDKRGLRQIHCSSILTEIPSARNRLYKKAQDVFAGAERKIKMGMLLFEGGFFLEASTPVREAVELALKAAACLAGEETSGTGDDPVSLRLVESTLVPERLLPDTALTTVARVRDALGSDALTHQDSAPKLIHECRDLVEHVNHGLIKAALE